MPDSYALWPAKGPPSDTLTKFPSRFVFRVEQVGPEGSRCVPCGDKLRKGQPQVLLKGCEGFRLQGYRCIACVQPHTLRQAGGYNMVEMDQAHAPPALARRARSPTRRMCARAGVGRPFPSA